MKKNTIILLLLICAFGLLMVSCSSSPAKIVIQEATEPEKELVAIEIRSATGMTSPGITDSVTYQSYMPYPTAINFLGLFTVYGIYNDGTYEVLTDYIVKSDATSVQIEGSLSNLTIPAVGYYSIYVGDIKSINRLYFTNPA